MPNSQRTTLVLLAAGMGSRYGGVKQIDGVGPNGEAIIDYSIYDALQSGFTDLCFVIRAEIEDAVRGFFAGKLPDNVGVTYAIQSLDDIPATRATVADRTKPWGTAHAVYAARKAVKTPFAVVNADDFYGRDSYAQVHNYLHGTSPDSADYAMVGFRLNDTLSTHGSVSRGICKTDDADFLVGIQEHKLIERVGDRVFDTLPDGSTAILSPDDVASMNMFGFTPKVFSQIESEFTAFIEQNADDPKSEFYIPTLMASLIDSGSARMKVLSTASQWFGMTYKEDKQSVQEQIRSYIENGHYPRNLWG